MSLYKTDNYDEIVTSKAADKQRRVFIGNPGSIKMSADECRSLIKKMPSGLEYLPGYEARLVKYVITKETCDRYGDIVRANGANLANFRNNPVIQFAHDYSQLPVGNSIKTTRSEGRKSIEAIALFFDDRVDSSGRSDTIFRFVKSNALRAVSIGFTPIEVRIPKTKEEREKIGLGPYGVEFVKWDLMEFSAVPVPANPEALTNAYLDEYQKELRNAIINGINDGYFEKKHVDVLREYPLVDESAIDILIKKLDPKTTIVKDKTIDDIINNGCYDDNDEEVSKSIEEIVSKDPELEFYLKPYPNEHACRIKDPSQYEEFRRGTRKSDGKTYSVVYGKNGDAWEEQAYRYNKKTWSEDEAKKHCTEHDGQKFEPASEKPVHTDSNDFGNVAPVVHNHIINFEWTKFDEMEERIKKSIVDEVKGIVQPLLDQAAGGDDDDDGIYAREILGI